MAVPAMTSDNQQPPIDFYLGKEMFIRSAEAMKGNQQPMSVDELVERVLGCLRTASGYYRENNDKDGDYEVARAKAQINQLIHEAWTKGYHAGKDSE